jgi:hypothetical protein
MHGFDRVVPSRKIRAGMMKEGRTETVVKYICPVLFG